MREFRKTAFLDALTARGMSVAWLTLAISLSLTAWAWRLTEDNAELGAHDRFHFRINEIRTAINDRMRDYEAVLRGSVGLFNASEDVTREEWRVYVQSLKIDQVYPGIQGVGFVKQVSSLERDAHIRRIRTEGFPGYAIWPPGERAEYMPAIYLEPFAGRNLRVFGYDVLSEPVRRMAVEQARDTSEAAISGKVTLVQETAENRQAGFILFLPVYRKGMPVDTVEQRRAALFGFVYTAFRMDDLMRGTLGANTPDVDIEIFDGVRMTEESLMYDNDRAKRFNLPDHGGSVFSHTISLDTHGHVWTLYMASLPAFEVSIDKDKPRMVLAGSTFISLLFFIIAWSLVSKRSSALAMNEELKAEVIERKQTEEALSKSTSEWTYAMDFIEDPLCLVDLEDKVMRANRAFCQFTGRTPETILGRTLTSLMHPKGETVPCPVCQARKARRDAYITRESDDPTNPAGRATEVTVRMIRNDAGEPTSMLVGIRDLTRTRQAEEALRLRNRAIEASINAIMIVNCTKPDNPIEYVNPAFERITGYSAAEVLGRNPTFLHGDDRDQPEIEKIRAAIRERREGRAVLRNYRKDGSLFWNDLQIAPVRDSTGKVTHFIGVQNEITEAKRYQEELEHQANHDTLTGLANRNLLNDRLRQAMVYAQRHGRPAVAAFVDLDQFKFINDSLGHTAGDQLLKTVAGRLKSCVREDDTVARLGGDEFVMILNDQEDATGISHLMQRVLDAVAQPMMIEGREFYITCSIGLSLYPQDGQDVETLLKNADVAMYRAKEQGGNNFQFYTMEMNARLTERLLLEGSLRHALERAEFLLHYQPRVDLTTGKIIGMEALIRWQHPDLGLISPARFIPLAEETGLIIPIGEWVFKTACAQNKAWQDAGLPAVSVSVNLSARQFRQKDLAKSLVRILRETGLEPRYLEVELTESLVMHNAEEFIDAMEELKALGIQISIDDFGTGYSSLSYLKRFPIDRLKLDQSFVRDIHSDPNDAAIAQTVIVLGHSLNLKVIAEGVETEEQSAFLRAHHCDEAQGFYFSRPVSVDDFTPLLREGGSLPLSQDLSMTGIALNK